MRHRTTALLMSGALAAGAFGAVAVTPASAATSDNPVSSRLASIRSALSGLVTEGTLTRSQADEVATTLDEKLPRRGPGRQGGLGGPGGLGPDGPRRGLRLLDGGAAAAKALGLTEDQLRTALRSGKSLADVAKTQKVSVDALVKAVVADVEKRLAAAVTARTVTQAQADRVRQDLTQRVTDRVNRVRPQLGDRRGFGGPGSSRDRSDDDSGAGSSGGTSSSTGTTGGSSGSSSPTGWSL